MWTEVGSSVGFCDVLQLLAVKHSAIYYLNSSAFIT